MSNQQAMIDEWGFAHGMSQAHPKGEHSMAVGFSDRKLKALHGIGGVSRNDPHIDSGHASMPWDSIQLPMPSHPEIEPLPTTLQRFGQAETPMWWDHLEYGPDHSKHPQEGPGDLAQMFFSTPFFSQDRE